MERNIPALIAQMTLEEKAGLCSGQDNWHLKAIERLGLPAVMVSDGPHGLRKQEAKGDNLGINDSIEAVCFPAACAAAASFDEALLAQMGDALGQECRTENLSVLLGPAINIKRSPLCGRNFEYFSEDPFLAGKLAAAEIRGIQKWDVGVSVKHFAANNQEHRRMTCSSNMDERTLREIYLTAFEIAVKEAKPWTMMCAYNKLNGEFASENKHLLTHILRDEWGFDGYVMSDWGAVNDRVKGLEAGLDLEMPSSDGINDAKLVAAVKAGKLNEAVLDQAVARILNIVFRYLDTAHPEARFDLDEHHALAAKAAAQCAVLLKNSGVLPLSRGGSIAYIGGFAKTPRYQGGGSSHINAHKVSSALACAKNQVVYAESFTATGDAMDEAAFDEAVRTAKAAQVAVVFAGLPDSFESEGYDRRHMQLPACQNELIRRIAAVQKNTVVVLHTGSPVETPWADEVAAVLAVYLGGEGVGEATDALLYGEVSPSGRLPESWPLKLQDNPSYLNFPGDGHDVNYAEGVYVGYRYYDTKKMAVRWPFGHGLSYTTFAYANPVLSSPAITEGETLTLTLDVTNTGSCPGKEVVQLYVADRTGTPCRPEKELKGFAKVELAPGESKTVCLTLDNRSFQWYNEALPGWYAASGTYSLLICRSAQEVVLELPVQYAATTLLPLVATENTTVAELLADPRTAPAMEALMVRARRLFAKDESGSPAAEQADTTEIVRRWVENVPLRSLRSFNHMDDAAMQAMLNSLNAQLA